MSFGARILILGWIVVGVMGVAMVVVLTVGLRAQNRAELWVRHTLEVESGVRAVEADTYAMVGELRGYLLSHDPARLEESRGKLDAARLAVSRVQDLTADNPVQRTNVAALRTALEKAAAWSGGVIAATEQAGLGAGISAVLSGEGEADLRDIARHTGLMLAEERQLLETRRAEAARIRRAGFLSALLLTALTVIQLAASGVLIHARYASFRREQDLLVQARNYAESIVATVRQPLLVLDSYLHVVSANRAFYRVFVLRPEQTAGVPLAELAGGRWNIPELLARLHAVADGTEAEIENFAIEPVFAESGRRRLLLNAGRLHQPGVASGLTLLAIEDDTERARSEQRLKQTNAELEGFAYTVAHDLRAPLRGMQGFSEALIEDYASKLDATGLGYAQHIGKAARRMDELIRDLLEYSRVSRVEVQLEPLALGPAIAAARLQAGPLLAGAQIVVQEPLPKVLAQFAILVQVLSHLLANAAKFVAPGQTPRIVLRTEPSGGRHRLWIEDNGIGIAPQYQERIFRVFERLHAHDTYSGTGIGLAIVRKGAERLGAEVGVESAAGQGSRFWIDFSAA